MGLLCCVVRRLKGGLGEVSWEVGEKESCLKTISIGDIILHVVYAILFKFVLQNSTWLLFLGMIMTMKGAGMHSHSRDPPREQDI